MESTKFSWNKKIEQCVIPNEKGELKLNDEILVSNIRWFIVFRWAVIAALVIFQILTVFASDVLTQLGIIEQRNWPIILILVLSIANVSYIYRLDYCPPSKFNAPSINLWIQIIIDLICLSIVVHYIGSTATPAPFFYVLHITLACVFFSTRESLVVTIMVCIMYTILLLIENSLFSQAQQSVSTNSQLSEESINMRKILWVSVLDFLFLVVWYAISRLSIVVRTHQRQLIEAYKQINQVQTEKDQYALLMTHQLKSPLDAIRSKINLITAGYCGEASDETKNVLAKIDRRAKSMSALILDLLRLQRLKETCLDTAIFKAVDLETTINKCIDKLTPVINSKKITANLSLDNFIFRGIPDQLEILLENIISNAITYSHKNTSIDIRSTIDKPNNSANISITDHGIGIEKKELPNIFNEYFYSPRASLHNSSSSGIGLSIVKTAAENNKLQINVDSEPGLGTTFTVIFKNIQLPDEKM